MSEIFTEFEWKFICMRELKAAHFGPEISALCAKNLLAEFGVNSCPLKAAQTEIDILNGEEI